MEIIINYLVNPETMPGNIWEIIKIIRFLFLFFTAFLIFIIIFSWKKSDWLKFRYFERAEEFLKARTYDTNKLAKNWKKIKKRMESGLEAEYRLAVIEADAMLEEILARMGFTQKTLEEKIGALTSVDLPNIEELKAARKTRDDIVHDPAYQLSADKTSEVLSVYENSFKSLSAI